MITPAATPIVAAIQGETQPREKLTALRSEKPPNNSLDNAKPDTIVRPAEI